MVRRRKNFQLRLQPYSDSLLAEVIDYFRTLDKEEVNQMVSDILVAAFLPLARYHQQSESKEDLRITCLNSCESLNRHGDYLRQLLRVAPPSTLKLLLSSNLVAEPEQLVSRLTEQYEPEKNFEPEDLEEEEKSSTAVAETEEIFGGFDD